MLNLVWIITLTGAKARAPAVAGHTAHTAMDALRAIHIEYYENRCKTEQGQRLQQSQREIGLRGRLEILG